MKPGAAEVNEIFANLRRAKKDTPQRLARDIKRLRNLQDRELSEKTREVLRSAAQDIGDRIARVAGQLSGTFIREVNRPRRTELQKHFIKAHDLLCREKGGAFPTYGAVLRKLYAMLPENCLPNDAIRRLRRLNKKLFLPMSGQRGRPRKIGTKNRPHKATISATRSVICSRRDHDRLRANRN